MPEAAAGVLSDDKTLVDRARSGDRAAQGELYVLYRDVAYRVAYRNPGSADDAEDAVHEAFIKAFHHLIDFDGRSGFKTWLMRIITNAAIDAGRKRKRRPSLGLGTPEQKDVEPMFYEDPARSLNREDLRRLLDSALNRLTPTIRSTIILYADGELSYKEIAEIQKVPIGTVMSRLHYARHKLQSFLNLDEIVET